METEISSFEETRLGRVAIVLIGVLGYVFTALLNAPFSDEHQAEVQRRPQTIEDRAPAPEFRFAPPGMKTEATKEGERILREEYGQPTDEDR